VREQVFAAMAAAGAVDGVSRAIQRLDAAEAELRSAKTVVQSAVGADGVDAERIAEAKLGVAKADLFVAKAELSVAKAELGLAEAKWEAATDERHLDRLGRLVDTAQKSVESAQNTVNSANVAYENALRAAAPPHGIDIGAVRLLDFVQESPHQQCEAREQEDLHQEQRHQDKPSVNPGFFRQRVMARMEASRRAAERRHPAHGCCSFMPLKCRSCGIVCKPGSSDDHQCSRELYPLFSATAGFVVLALVPLFFFASLVSGSVWLNPVGVFATVSWIILLPFVMVRWWDVRLCCVCISRKSGCCGFFASGGAGEDAACQQCNRRANQIRNDWQGDVENQITYERT